ncbi:MAG: zinc ribbon domain-containing protein [Gammaproteobacteria bacterium]
MPIYEYQCNDCGHKLEILQRMSDEPLKTCPSCSQESLRKLVSAAGFQLKGTGWYVTDFRDKGKKPATKSGDGESAAPASKADDKGADKSATKSDTKTTPASAPSGTD